MKTVLVSALVLLASAAIAPAVHAQSDSQPTDQQLAHAVRVAEARSGVGMSHVFVLAHSGHITLVGWVPERDHVARAEQSAMSVPGVTSVDNRLSPDGGSLNAH
ncbi:BON domain-containing protein [Paraburkholderia sp. MMS20-SJTN17]|uniref:BON domain-containing protein n=1 Tax=Paraburkholderia translucens TaxID=2886945 RepID=A0ABS8KCX3_9BURK|nr:BON domain-containing protein [Paraburkholderia sp. MMS20-SJTN17]MCC8402616.1 BON domain-containing protein [Paraburkholderia sp. MMS20-SJTN17]